jgi:peptidoglycan/LPS O-acetylase OafA/YrhL
MSQSTRIVELDGLRGIAIILVLIMHYLYSQLSITSSPFLASALQLLSLTWSGVDLFFVLSGFLISGILLDNRQASNYFRTFYQRRFFRIFPLYFFVLGVYACFRLSPLFQAQAYSWLFIPAIPFWPYVLFVQNFVFTKTNYGGGWLSHTWSLAVEEQFYVIMPLLIYKIPSRVLVAMAATYVLLAPFVRLIWPPQTGMTTQSRVDGLLLGFLIAVAFRTPKVWERICQQETILRICLGVLFVCFIRISIQLPSVFVFAYSGIVLMYALLLALILVNLKSTTTQVFRSPSLVWMGNLSFGIYLYHQPISGLLHGFLRGHAPAIKTLSDASITGLALLLTFIMSFISFRYFEEPLLRIGHRAKYHPR